VAAILSRNSGPFQTLVQLFVPICSGTPYSLATPVIALMLDYLWFGKVISPSEMVGMAVIFIAFLFAF